MSSNTAIKRVAIIGSGIAGLSCARKLQSYGVAVDVFEKSRGASGRMSTRRNEEWAADHGAQYFTARDPRFHEEVQRWMQAGIAAIWSPKLKVFTDGVWHASNSKETRYVGIPSMNSPGKYLAEDLLIQYETTITKLERADNQWALYCNENRAISALYDYVVLAIPAPQASVLVKSLDSRASDIADSAQMKACWTMMAHFPNQPTTDFDAAFINQEMISWVCQNGSKPLRQGSRWTIHGSPAWSQENVELSKEDAQNRMMEGLKRLGFDCRNSEISMHRWRYASGGLENSTGFLSLPDISLGLCGDWLNGGRVEGAWLSGVQLAASIHQFTKNIQGN